MNKKVVKKGANNNKHKKNFTKRDKVKEERNLSDEELNQAKLSNHSRFGNPNWYFTDHELAEQSSRFSFQSFIGNGELVQDVDFPSIAVLSLNPAVGPYVGVAADSEYDDAVTKAINMQARKLYSSLATKSGRTQSYAPQDVMTLLLALGEIVSCTSYLRRALGLVFTYNQRNRDFPSHILKAMGIDPDDLFENLGVYRVKFNTILNIANKIPFPANISWFEKCAALYDSLFQDSPDDMAQIYCMVPHSTWILDETAMEEGTVLTTIPWCAQDLGSAGTLNVKSFDAYLDILRGMIDALFTSSTYNIIYGDILNYVSNNNVPLLHLDVVSEDYSVFPVYDEEMLLHIHNCTVLGMPKGATNTPADLEGYTTSRYNDVFPEPNTNSLYYAPVFTVSATGNIDLDKLPQLEQTLKDIDLVDFPYGNPDLTERIEATRFSIRLDHLKSTPSAKASSYDIFATALPDHYVVNITIFNNGDSITIPPIRTLFASTTGNIYNLLCNIAKFRYFPILYRFNNAEGGNGGKILNVSGDVNYFTHLDGQWINRLNELCLQGLLELR